MNEKEEDVLAFKPVDFLEEFVKEIRKSLAHGEEKWGDTWLHRPREGQEQRIKQYFDDQFDRHLHAGAPIRWEAIAGEALIGWIRDNYPGFFEGKDDRTD